MILIFKKIYRFFLSIKSIILINLKIRIKKIFNKNYKVIFFYFPVKAYQDNIIELIEEIKKIESSSIILGFNAGSSKEIKKFSNSYFLNLGYLKYITDIDIFLSSYVIYNYPKAKNKIYINHDIYDTPMVNNEQENDLMKTLNKCNYIFLSSEISVENFKNKFFLYLGNNQTKNTKFINTGYLKLDHVFNKLGQIEFTEDSILLAPTLSTMFDEFNITSYLDELINKILTNPRHKLIYRPHPGDYKNDHYREKIQIICDKYKNNNNFNLDDNTSYLKSYKKSKFLITDFSSTAYTYAFSTLKPVIFLSKNEQKLLNTNFKNLFFFKDRENIGKIVENIDNLEKDMDLIENNLQDFSYKIKTLREKRIKYFNKSIKQNLLHIKEILQLEND